MNIAQVIWHDVANGPGIRLSVFVSGCRIRCHGCFQPQTWDFGYGREYTKEIENMLLSELSRPEYQGLTILGGEPFEPENQGPLLKLVKRAKGLGRKDIWCYTGNTLGTLRDEQSRCHTDSTEGLLGTIDVLVAGPFLQNQRNVSLPWCGSSNQQVIDLNATRENGYQETILFGA